MVVMGLTNVMDVVITTETTAKAEPGTDAWAKFIEINVRMGPTEAASGAAAWNK